nr:uroplakin-3b-like [Pogona vitticeps]
MHIYAMKLTLLLCLIGGFESGWTIPLENLEKITQDFFPNSSMLLTTYLSTSFIVNVPKCVSSSKFSPSKVRIAVAKLPDASTLPGVTDTDEILNLRKTPEANLYFAGEFKSVSCRVARDLLVMDMDDSQYELITVIGYQVGAEFCRQTKGPFCNQALKPSTFYRVNFFFLDDKSAIRAHTDWSTAIQTRNVTNHESADVMFGGRAGGMIVITILVSVGGAVLAIALIVAVALSNKK